MGVKFLLSCCIRTSLIFEILFSYHLPYLISKGTENIICYEDIHLPGITFAFQLTSHITPISSYLYMKVKLSEFNQIKERWVYMDTIEYFLEYSEAKCNKSLPISYGKDRKRSVKLFISLHFGKFSPQFTSYDIRLMGQADDKLYLLQDLYGHLGFFVSIKKNSSVIVPRVSGINKKKLYPPIYNVGDAKRHFVCAAIYNWKYVSILRLKIKFLEHETISDLMTFHITKNSDCDDYYLCDETYYVLTGYLFECSYNYSSIPFQFYIHESEYIKNGSVIILYLSDIYGSFSRSIHYINRDGHFYSIGDESYLQILDFKIRPASLSKLSGYLLNGLDSMCIIAEETKYSFCTFPGYEVHTWTFLIPNVQLEIVSYKFNSFFGGKVIVREQSSQMMTKLCNWLGYEQRYIGRHDPN